MRNFMIGTAAVALAVSGTALAAQGQGKGNDKGKGGAQASAKANVGGGERGGKAAARVETRQQGNSGQNGRGQDKARGNDRAEVRGQAAARVQANARPERREARKERAEVRNERQGQNRAAERRDNDDRRDYARDDRRDDRNVGNGNAAVRQTANIRYRDDDRWDWDFVRQDRDRRVIEGCPPGLAKKNNGCLPPGLARNANWQDDRDWDRGWNGYRYRPTLFGLSNYDAGRYYYDDGYLFRMGNAGGIAGYIPLLGGALAIGNPWPASYQSYDVPGYYEDYYNLGADNSYRYADNVIYRVDPQNAAIRSVVALLTGDQFNVGQQMPSGYDVYNVPYAYRDRYYDTPQANYRYSDGYVYQVDPETQLIAAAIDLLV